jgi:carbon starvation protein
VACESDAQSVGYGAMLLESALAVVVIMACTAGVGMGALKAPAISAAGASPAAANPADAVAAAAADSTTIGKYDYVSAADGTRLSGRAAWQQYYRMGSDGQGWEAQNKLDRNLRAFVEGGANFLTAIGVPLQLGLGIVAVLVASFAATTLDTATRLQRYVIQELGGSLHLPTQNKYVATSLAVGVAGLIAVFAGSAPGAGGSLLWPLFGATNQLLAGLAMMVATFYLWRRNKAIAFIAIPALLMMLVPGWAMTYNLIYDWIPNGKWLLAGFGCAILLLQIWMFIEGLLMWKKARGVLEPQLAPLPTV